MFIGRKQELALLKGVYESNSFAFGIIHGRRRVGKTTLIRESLKAEKSLYLLAQQSNIDVNLELFSQAYAAFKNVKHLAFKSMADFLTALFEEDMVVVIDEFTYLIEADRSIESLLQGLIDQYHASSSLKLIISGSEVGMYENVFGHSRPLFNRQTFSLHLKECTYLESSLYYPSYGPEDKVRAYAIFGGLPYYLRQIDDKKSLKENICDLVLIENARFAHEVEMLLKTELRSIGEYQSVLQAIHSGSTRLSEIDSKARIHKTSKTIKYIQKLMELEIIEREERFLDAKTSKKHLYRIKNNFIAFYYTFIWKNHSARTMMNPDLFYDTLITPTLEQYVSVRFEKICAQYLIYYFQDKKIPLMAIGRYWANDRNLKQDIEIDVCAKSIKDIYVFECKWMNQEVGPQTVKALKDKGTHVKATKWGAFSKSGFDQKMTQKDMLFTPDDLFNKDLVKKL